MKRVAACLSALLCLAVLCSACGKKEPAPKAARPSVGLAAQLAENNKKFDELAGRMAALAAAVVPDRQQTAMIIIKENLEKGALVCLYESRGRDGAVTGTARAAMIRFRAAI